MQVNWCNVNLRPFWNVIDWDTVWKFRAQCVTGISKHSKIINKNTRATRSYFRTLFSNITICKSLIFNLYYDCLTFIYSFLRFPLLLSIFIPSSFSFPPPLSFLLSLFSFLPFHFHFFLSLFIPLFYPFIFLSSSPFSFLHFSFLLSLFIPSSFSFPPLFSFLLSLFSFLPLPFHSFLSLFIPLFVFIVF